MRTILREVVPRTIESSISTTRWPSMIAAHRVELHLDAEVADRLLGLDERPADVVVARHAELERQPRLAAVAERGVEAAVGHRHHDVGGRRRLARQLGAQAAARPRPPSRRRPRCRGGRSRRARRAQRDGSRAAGARRNDSSSAVARHDDLARLELAQLLRAPAGRRRTTPRRSSGSRSSSPIASGRKPCGSRAAIRQLSVIRRSE